MRGKTWVELRELSWNIVEIVEIVVWISGRELESLMITSWVDE